ncbi:PREDICTED: chymotrypsin-1-like [Wasmannia auropunctata]|uniref:chymotrypsin-1-like n=1 Tax=Wasmannia auropunctata TaxID=64793 RepID=UPI0005F09DDD|nr:PREDICTED: chymotrypsin-1-like [Wasmannia auropunctata]
MFSITGLVIVSLIYHAYGVPDTQIVGGKDAPPGKYPYQVSLKRTFSGDHFCGGAIISEKYIITAAHCFQNLVSEGEVIVDVGSTQLYVPESRYTVDKLIPHPQYNSTLKRNDVALIRLTKNINFTKNAKAIEIISENRNFEHVGLTVTGWGRTSREGSIPERLQEIVVTGYSQQNCSTFYPNCITDNHLCTLQSSGQGMCNGDSGGAITYEGKLVGIVSFGKKQCASGYPDVFTKVVNHKGWINEYLVNAGTNQQSNIIFGLLMTYLCIHSFL